MSHGNAEQQNLAERLTTVLRRFKREDGNINKLAENVGCDLRDLTRWANGTTLPGHILIALLDELPRHLADHMIGASGFRLVSKEACETVNALRAASAASAFSSDVAMRMADGEWCHRDEVAAKEHAERVITELQNVAGG